jgi:hypothetical protein
MDSKAMQKYIEDRSTKCPMSDCWIWLRQVDKHGYGQFRKTSKSKWSKTHRVSIHAFKGIDPIGKCVLHICDVPSCVNPDHLYLGTQKENVRDMQQRGRSNYKGVPKTHCKYGHELTPENRLGKRADGCKICHKFRQQKYRQERKNSL